MSPEWPSAKISEVCELIIDCVNKTAPVVDGPTPYKMIRTTNVRDGWVDTINVRNVDEETYKKWTRRGEPRNGDVILTREAPLGEVGLLRDARGIFLGQRLVMYRVNPAKLDNRFLLYSLLGDDLKGQIKAFGSGSTVEHMRVPDCEKLILQLPPLKTQQKIGSILSTYDDLIENNTRRIKILEEMARMLYREWFVNFRFPGHEKVKMVDSSLGLIPEGWKVKSFDDVALNFDRLRKPLSSMQRLNRKGPYPYYGAAKIFDYIDDYIFDGEYLLIAEDGSVITPDRKPVLQMTSGKFWANNHTHIIQGKQPVSTEFLYLCLRELDISGYVTGAAQPKITQANMNRIPVLVPTSDLLKSFSKNARTSFSQIKVLAKKNQNLHQTRDLLLPKLISGEVAV